jgi:hypothetical protein
MQEHCLILLIGLVDGAQRKDILDRFGDDPKIQKMISKSKTISILKEDADFAIDLWDEYHETLDEDDLTSAMYKTRKLKEEIYDLLTDGYWIGFNFQGLVEHMIEELKFFQNQIDEKTSPDDEVRFWKKHNTQDSGLVAHLIDPTEIPFTEAFLDLQRDGKKLKARILEVIEFTQRDMELGEELDSEKTPNIIYPFLALHEKKEHEYCLQRLSELLEFD